jgi:hypothetical protein
MMCYKSLSPQAGAKCNEEGDMSSLITTIIIMIIITCTLPLTKTRVAKDVLPRGKAGRSSNGKQHFFSHAEEGSGN